MYTISIDNREFQVSGSEVAWEAFQAAAHFADLIGSEVVLFDKDGEVLAES